MSQGQSALWRFAVVAALLAATAGFLRERSHGERLPQRQPLSSFPVSVGVWQGRDLGIDPSALEILGPGEFLSRAYFQPGQPYIDFLVAYFPSQRTGNSIHSPKNCLPGAGWSPAEAGHMTLAAPGRAPVVVNSYVISKGMNREVVLYWYQAHDRIIASEYKAKFYLVADAIRMNRTDGALVRVITPLDRGETVGSGQRRATVFAEQILPMLSAYIPR
jgi:EpsI family protein